MQQGNAADKPTCDYRPLESTRKRQMRQFDPARRTGVQNRALKYEGCHVSPKRDVHSVFNDRCDCSQRPSRFSARTALGESAETAADALLSHTSHAIVWCRKSRRDLRTSDVLVYHDTLQNPLPFLQPQKTPHQGYSGGSTLGPEVTSHCDCAH